MENRVVAIILPSDIYSHELFDELLFPTISFAFVC